MLEDFEKIVHGQTDICQLSSKQRPLRISGYVKLKYVLYLVDKIVHVRKFGTDVVTKHFASTAFPKFDL